MSMNTIPEFLANVPNIEHCNVRTVGNPPIVYVITAHEGYYIHRNDGDEDNINTWKTTTSIRNDEDPAILVIVPESELPEGAEICGGETEPETETM